MLPATHGKLDSAAMRGNLKGSAIEEHVDLSQATVELNPDSRIAITRALHAAETFANHAESGANIAAAIAHAAADSAADLQAAADVAREMSEEANAKMEEAAETARKARESAQMAASLLVAEPTQKSNKAAAAADLREPASEVARMSLPVKPFPFSKQKTGFPPPPPSGWHGVPGVGEGLLVLKASVRSLVAPSPPPKLKSPMTTSKTKSPSGVVGQYLGPLLERSSPY